MKTSHLDPQNENDQEIILSSCPKHSLFSAAYKHIMFTILILSSSFYSSFTVTGSQSKLQSMDR